VPALPEIELSDQSAPTDIVPSGLKRAPFAVPEALRDEAAAACTRKKIIGKMRKPPCGGT
jgi:hypothetical protein